MQMSFVIIIFTLLLANHIAAALPIIEQRSLHTMRFFAFLFVICVKRKERVLYPFFAFDATSHKRNVAI